MAYGSCRLHAACFTKPNGTNWPRWYLLEGLGVGFCQCGVDSQACRGHTATWLHLLNLQLKSNKLSCTRHSSGACRIEHGYRGKQQNDIHCNTKSFDCLEAATIRLEPAAQFSVLRCSVLMCNISLCSTSAFDLEVEVSVQSMHANKLAVQSESLLRSGSPYKV